MIKVNIDELFPITASLVDETDGSPAAGETVNYDIRKQPSDLSLSPAVSGVLTESTVEPGVYKTLVSISEAGTYIVYVSCPGFISNTEDVIVNSEDIYDVVKQSRHYNISVENVTRSSHTPSASQAARNVPRGRTDYVITRIKRDQDLDWSGAHVVEGRVYAHYIRSTDKAPYKMSSEY